MQQDEDDEVQEGDAVTVQVSVDDEMLELDALAFQAFGEPSIQFRRHGEEIELLGAVPSF